MSHFLNTLGHEEAKARLSAAVTHRKVSHAYLFEGIRGVGKHTLAMDFIKMLLCTEPQVSDRACGRCLSCRKVDAGNHPDVIRVGREDKASVGVGVIRQQIRHTIHVRPLQSDWKIYLIEDGETMTTEAQNALLKTLEEPPAYALILILASDSQVFLSTVLSRVQRIRLQPLSDDLVAEGLVRQGAVSKAGAPLIAQLSRGSIGEGIRLLETTDFTTLRDTLIQWLKRLTDMKASEVLSMSAFFSRYKDKQSAEQQEMILEILSIWFRDILVYQMTGSCDRLINPDHAEDIRAAAGRYLPADVMRLSDACESVRRDVRDGAQFPFAMDCLLMEMIDITDATGG